MSPPMTVQSRTHLTHFLDAWHSRAPGIRVVEPDPTDARARRGNLYILVELMGESPVRTRAMEQLQSAIENTYYTAGGSVSSVLEQAIQAAHTELYNLNQRSPNTDLRAGVLCTALVQGHLVMLAAGPSLALISTGQRLDQFPPGPQHYVTPLGGEGRPEQSIYRHKVAHGDAIFMGESDWVLLTDVKTLGGAVANVNLENQQDVMDYLRRNSNNAEILGLLIVIERVQTTHTRRRPGGGLPTAMSAAPPVRDVPAAGHQPERRQRSEPRARPHAQQRPARRLQEPRRAGNQTASQAQRPARSAKARQIEIFPPDQDAGERSLPFSINLGPVLSTAGRIAAETRRRGVELWHNMLPDRRIAAKPPEWVGSLPDLGSLPSLGRRTRSPEQRPPFVLPARTQGGRARLFILLALLIPLLAFATVGAAYLQQGASNRAEGVKLVDMAEEQLLRAQQALGVGDQAAARAALGEAQRYLDEAVTLIGMTTRAQELTAEIQQELQGLLQVRSLYSLDIPLVAFPPEADPHRVIVHDQDVYVLDNGRQVVEAFRTDPTRSLVAEERGIILQEGEVVEGVTVGRLVDMAWQPRVPGFVDKASLLILDRNNNIFRYNSVDEATHLRVASSEQLQGVSQLDTYGGRLYLVDEQANQIWRYSPAGLGYEDPPEPWLSPQVQVDLAGVVSMAIDGDIWLLTEDSNVLRYRQQQQVPFSLETIAGAGERAVDMSVGSEADGVLFLADANQNRLLVFDKQGNYIEQYQAAENNALRGLRGLYLDDISGTLFILTQTSLYSHSQPR